jgi:hypothetical protein
MKSVASLKGIFSNPKNFADVVMCGIITAIQDTV